MVAKKCYKKIVFEICINLIKKMERFFLTIELIKRKKDKNLN